MKIKEPLYFALFILSMIAAYIDIVPDAFRPIYGFLAGLAFVSAIGKKDTKLKTVEDAVKLIVELYNTPGGGAGGYGHLVFDDDNIEDEMIQHCLNEAKNGKGGHFSEETRIASIKALEAILPFEPFERTGILYLAWKQL